MGTRETQRREWREAVARAAEEYGARALRCRAASAAEVATDRMWSGAGNWSVDFHIELIEDSARKYAALAALDEARVVLLANLAEPKPWTRPAKADRGGWMRRTKCGVDDTEPCWACLDEAGEALRRKRRAAQRRRR